MQAWNGLFWRCGCGEELPTYGQLLAHRRAQKRAGRPCPGIGGLFDGQGNRLAASLTEARRLGLVDGGGQGAGPRGNGAAGAVGRGGAAGQRPASTTRARMRLVDVDLDPSLWILFDLARLRWPDEYQDTPQGFARWLEECIFAFYAEHARELGFDLLLARSLERLGLGREISDRLPEE